MSVLTVKSSISNPDYQKTMESSLWRHSPLPAYMLLLFLNFFFIAGSGSRKERLFTYTFFAASKHAKIVFHFRECNISGLPVKCSPTVLQALQNELSPCLCFSAKFTTGNNYCEFLVTSVDNKVLPKWSIFIRKEFAPVAANSLLLDTH